MFCGFGVTQTDVREIEGNYEQRHLGNLNIHKQIVRNNAWGAEGGLGGRASRSGAENKNTEKYFSIFLSQNLGLAVLTSINI